MKRILCFGESNTYGYDPRSYFDRMWSRSCWAAMTCSAVRPPRRALPRSCG